MYPRSFGKMKQWLLQENQDRRRALRLPKPEIVVHYWDGSAPKGRQVRDVSESGAYIYAQERWYVGTIIRLILQVYQSATGKDGSTAPVASTCIPGRVVRHDSDGVAVEFVFRNKSEEKTFRTFLAGIPHQASTSMATGFPQSNEVYGAIALQAAEADRTAGIQAS